MKIEVEITQNGIPTPDKPVPIESRYFLIKENGERCEIGGIQKIDLLKLFNDNGNHIPRID